MIRSKTCRLVTLIVVPICFFAGSVTLYKQFEKTLSDISHHGTLTKELAVPTLSSNNSNNGEADGGTCVMTISAMNEFANVLHLFNSVQESTPSIKCFVWYMADFLRDEKVLGGLRDDIGETIGFKHQFRMVAMNELLNTTLEAAFKYNLLDFQTSIKAIAFEHTFKVLGAQSVIHLDHNVWVTESLLPFQTLLSKYSVVVTPQMPLPESGETLEFSKVSSIFNLGFLGFSRTNTTLEFLKLWGEHLRLYGATKEFANFIPTLFDHDDHYVLRDTKYSMSCWSLHEGGTGIHVKEGIPSVKNSATEKEEKCRIVPFSGVLTCDSWNSDGKNLPRLNNELISYTNRFEKLNPVQYCGIPYGFDRFENGADIKTWMRKLYRELTVPVSNLKGISFSLDPNLQFDPFSRRLFQQDKRWRNPFESFPQWILESTPSKRIDMDGNYFYSYFQEQTWLSRPDLQNAFPDPTGEHYLHYRDWFLENAHQNPQIDEFWFHEWKRSYEWNQEHHSTLHQRIQAKDDIGLNVYGWHGGQFSIGRLAKLYFDAAISANIPSNAIAASMVPGKKYVGELDLDYKLSRKANYPINLIVMNADCTNTFVKQDIPGVIWQSKYNIGIWNWELDRFRPEDIVFLADFDEIWVPSEFLKVGLEGSPGYDGTPVRTMPHPHEAKPFVQDSALPRFLEKYLPPNKGKKPFVFLLVFDFASYVQRKYPEATIRAFLEAFPIDNIQEQSNVQLIVKSHSGTAEQIQNLIEVGQNDPRIVFINTLLNDEESDALKEYQDCHVSLHRTEGFGMNIIESMLIGVPVIATNYGGNVQFFDATSSWNNVCTFPVPYTVIEIEEDYGHYTKGNHWAEPNVSAAANAMRTVLHTNCREQFGKQYAADIVSKFGANAFGTRMRSYLQDSLPQIEAKVNNYR